MLAAVSGRRRRWLRWVAGVAIGLVGLWYVPPVHLRVTSMVAVARAVGLPVPGVFGSSVRVDRVVVAEDLVGYLYTPAWPAPGIVLVHGAARGGANDPRIERLASAIARTGRVVFVPQLELRFRVLTRDDIDRLVRSVLYLQGFPFVDGSVGFVGISDGGSFALVAAADPRISRSVGFVATFGAYFDLRHVIQGITTHATTVHGRVVPWEPAPQAAGILRRQAEQLLSPAERAPLEQAVAGTLPPSALTPDARAVYDVLENRDPRRALPLIAHLPSSVLGQVETFSPSRYLRRIEAPVAVLQSLDDPAVPPSEAALLAHAFHAPEYLLTTFTHVTPGSLLHGLPDLWRATSFTTWVLDHGAQSGTP
jgi:dienelactone hydrolase